MDRNEVAAGVYVGIMRAFLTVVVIGAVIAGLYYFGSTLFLLASYALDHTVGAALRSGLDGLRDAIPDDNVYYPLLIVIFYGSIAAIFILPKWLARRRARIEKPAR